MTRRLPAREVVNQPLSIGFSLADLDRIDAVCAARKERSRSGYIRTQVMKQVARDERKIQGER